MKTNYNEFVSQAAEYLDVVDAEKRKVENQRNLILIVSLIIILTNGLG